MAMSTERRGEFCCSAVLPRLVVQRLVEEVHPSGSPLRPLGWQFWMWGVDWRRVG